MSKSLPLPPVIHVDQDKCVNCHACIDACPVKLCNDGSGDYVKVNKDLCIACGHCLKACTHGARTIIDDCEAFFQAAKEHEHIVAIVAPAIAASFPHKYLKINGWLKSIGVAAIFDVSFGAELTIKTYLEYAKQHNPKCIIAQPCPAIVAYIETYRPELLPYLAVGDSPMMHTIKMIKEFYPQYANHKIVIISPCGAKKREFEEVGMGDYNVTIKSIDDYMTRARISLDSFPEVDFNNPPAERAVLFSTPGGLRDTAERWKPGIGAATRKIEGVDIIYKYLDELPRMIAEGKAPLIIDCLNCEMGCNGGPGTLAKDRPLDEVEGLVSHRKEEMKKRYIADRPATDAELQDKIVDVINKYWKPGLYEREYVNRSANITYHNPNSTELEQIYHQMKKFDPSDIKNCTACGYGTCEKMAIAIANGLNRPENCHFYQHSIINIAQEQKSVMLKEAARSFDSVKKEVELSTKFIGEIDPIVKQINDSANQTNLLAINAAIQASHAGQYGLTFNVVANEVKELASRSQKEADKIKPFADKLRKNFATVNIQITELAEKIIEIIKK